MNIRWLGHSCIELVGKSHILVDPDYLVDPMPDVDYVCLTHGHRDHFGKAAELQTGRIIASGDVCDTARKEGVPEERLVEGKPGDRFDSINVLKGHSATGFLTELMGRLLGVGGDLSGGTPLAFFIEDELSVLHPGDGLKATGTPRVDVLCLPYMKFVRSSAVKLANQINPKYVIPIHFDCPWTVDPEELRERLTAEVVLPRSFVELRS